MGVDADPANWGGTELGQVQGVQVVSNISAGLPDFREVTASPGEAFLIVRFQERSGRLTFRPRDVSIKLPDSEEAIPCFGVDDLGGTSFELDMSGPIVLAALPTSKPAVVFKIPASASSGTMRVSSVEKELHW